MPKSIELSEIAEKNPRVDLNALEEGRKLRQNLHQSATKRRTALPNDRRRVRIDDDVSSDPRAVRLQRSLKVKR